MGTAAWGGSEEGKCFPCHGLSWWRLLLYFPNQPRKTAVRPKLSAVSVIRLFVRTRQPSATLASPLVCMRETTSLALRSVLHKETSRWSAATTPQEPREIHPNSTTISSRTRSVSSTGIAWRSTFAKLSRTPGVFVVLDPVTLMAASLWLEIQSVQTTQIATVETLRRRAFVEDGQQGVTQALGSATPPMIAKTSTNARTRSVAATAIFASISATILPTALTLVIAAQLRRVTLVLAKNLCALSREIQKMSPCSCQSLNGPKLGF